MSNGLPSSLHPDAMCTPANAREAEIAAAAKSDATAAFKAGDYETAAALFRRAISLGHEEPHALYGNVAACQASLGKHEAALAAADAAIAASSEYVKGHYRRALALSALERWDDAVAACKLALKLPGATGAVSDQLSTLLAKCEAEVRPKENPKWMKEDQAEAWKERQRENSAVLAAAERAQETIRAKAASVQPLPAPAPPEQKMFGSVADRVDAAALARLDAASAPRVAINDAALAAADRARDEIRAKAAAGAGAVGIPAAVPIAASFNEAVAAPTVLSAAPADPAAEVARRQAAGAAAAAAMAEEAQARREKAHAERRRREAAEAERRVALDEAVANRNATLRDDLVRRRKEDTAAAAKDDGHKQAAMKAAAELIDRAPEVDGEDGERLRALADGAQARAKVSAWRVKALPTNAGLKPPRVPADFTKQYALLRKDARGLYAYLRLVPPEACVAIFNPEIPAEVLVSAARAISEHIDGATAAHWHAWLGALSKVGRFEMTVLMLDKPARGALVAMFDALASALAQAPTDAPSVSVADLRKLRASYLGKE